MRIAMFSWETLHSIRVGGVAVHVTELSAALQRKGHDVHVFTRMGNGQSEYENIHGVHYHRCPFNLNNNFVDEINDMCRSFVWHYFGTEDFVGKFDVVHAHDWLASNAAVWTKQGRGTNALLTIHSTEYGRCGNNLYDGQSSKIRELEWSGTYHCNKVISVSNALKDEVKWIYSVPDDKIHTVYNGVPTDQFAGKADQGAIKAKYGIGPLDPTVLFAGRLACQKGPDILMEAIPYILYFYPNAKFVFAGDGNMRLGLEHRAAQLGIYHAVRFLGHVSGDPLVELYKGCDTVCVPSRNEPFGIVILEAWSAGKPVVATCNGGPSELITHNVTGYKIYPNSESVAWGIGNIFRDFDHARWMGQNGLAKARNSFSWDIICDQVLDIYKSLGR